MSTTNELVRKLKTDYRSPGEEWPTDDEIAVLESVASDDDYPSAAALVEVIRLNRRYRSGDHASAVIAGCAYDSWVRFHLQPAYVPPVADVLLLMRELNVSQDAAVKLLGGQP